jgi:predicted PurR-regulated permease PerM
MNEKNPNTKHNSDSTLKTVLIFAIVIASIMLISQISVIKYVITQVISVLSPVFVGVILAYIINPIYVMFEKWFTRILSRSKKISSDSVERSSRVLSVIISVVCLLLFIALLLFLIIPEFLDSLTKLIAIAPSLFNKAVAYFSDSKFSDNVFWHNISAYVDSLVKALTSWLGGEFSTAVSGLVESLISVVSFLFDFLISIVVCVYALLEKKKFIAQMKKLIFAVFNARNANDILDVSRYGNEVFGKFISGKILTSTIVGIVTFAFMSIMGIPYPLLSAGIIAITNVIPFFGPFIGGIPTVFIILLTDVQDGVLYGIFLVILQQIEGNIIEPMIMEDKTGVSKFWVTFALLLFGSVFGLAGMIFSVPMIAVLFYTIRLLVERNLASKSLPISSDAYLSVGGVDAEKGVLLPNPEKEPHKTFRESISEWRSKFKKNKKN